MLREELVAYIAEIQRNKSEDSSVEFKAAQLGAPKIYDTLSSFSNQSGGGVILFGIDEKDYTLCGVYDGEDLQRKISERCLQMEPPVRAVCTVADIDGKTVVSAEIPEIALSQRPCYYKGAGRIQGSYIRVGDGDYKMTEYEIYSYEAYRQKIQDELRITPRTELTDIQTAYLDDYLTKLALAKPKLAGLPIEKVLSLQGFALDNAPTLAGTLLFSEYPQSFYPRLCITAVVVPGEEMGDLSQQGARFIDNQTIEGTIPQMLSDGLAFVRRNMKHATVIDRETGLRKDRSEYPIAAVRELLLNALIHRDYSIHTDTAPITLVLYQNRLEIESPGGLYGRLTLDNLGLVSADTRNPFLASAMEVTKDTENRFSGIPTVRREMKLAGLPAPVFENLRGMFKVTLYNQAPAVQQSTSTLDEEIVAFCRVVRTRKELAAQFPQFTKTYLFTNYVNVLVAQGRLRLGLPDKPKSTKQTYVAK